MIQFCGVFLGGKEEVDGWMPSTVRALALNDEMHIILLDDFDVLLPGI